MKSRTNHTINKLFKAETTHNILSKCQFLAIWGSLELHSSSENAVETQDALVQQVTFIENDRAAVPAPILKRIADQIEGRAKATTGRVSEADQAALEVCRDASDVAMTGPEAVEAKAAYIRHLVASWAGDCCADES